jgi:hypothetical protein
MSPGPLATGRRGERGSGLLSSLFGVTMLLVLLALASQVALGLLRRTTAEAVAYDAARRVATAPEGTSRVDAEARARQHARAVLGEAADGVELQFLPAPADRVVLQVRSEGVSLLPSALGDGVRVGGVDRRIVLVRETP